MTKREARKELLKIANQLLNRINSRAKANKLTKTMRALETKFNLRTKFKQTGPFFNIKVIEYLGW